MAYGWRHRDGGRAQNSPLGPPPPLVLVAPGGTFAAVTLPDEQLVAALRAGDEEAFSAVVREWHSALLRVARIFTPSRAVAEEVVQETWLRVLGALDRFEGRSSLKTWVFRILVNTAKTRAQREGQEHPVLGAAGCRARPRGGRRAGALPRRRPSAPSGRLGVAAARAARGAAASQRETREVIAGAIEALPANQRAVISLRDVEGLVERRGP